MDHFVKTDAVFADERMRLKLKEKRREAVISSKKNCWYDTYLFSVA
ncbi:hypothetical protein P618_200747 [Holospora obtusa F1]|uniref:Uncharacterized protein n=1 Tax=Holospora obtusa F1 TaxID=1399147 RepID=W6TGM5_HOLOB|nr:hypothetical protein P618_200747 [Holospora obtusa F1]